MKGIRDLYAGTQWPKLSLTLLGVIRCQRRNLLQELKKFHRPESKASKNRALRRAPENFRLLVDNLNQPGLELESAKKLVNRFLKEGNSFSGIASRTWKKVLDRLISLEAREGTVEEDATTFQKVLALLDAEEINGQTLSESSEEQTGEGDQQGDQDDVSEEVSASGSEKGSVPSKRKKGRASRKVSRLAENKNQGRSVRVVPEGLCWRRRLLRLRRTTMTHCKMRNWFHQKTRKPPVS